MKSNNTNSKELDKSFSEIHLPSDNVNDSISSPLVKNLMECSNRNKIQDYEEKEMAEQLLDQDLN